jgi:hypothetical protein
VRNNASVGDLGVSAGVESYGFGELAVAAAANHAALVSAICVDAQGAVMPAAQTFAAREVAQTFQGEIFRCAAAVHMRVTMDQRSFDCALGEALWYANGQAACSAQIARDPSNERWLLRHYGAGEKVVRIRETTAILPAASHATQFGPLPGSGGVGY